MCAWTQPKIEAIAGARLEVVRLEGRTPLIFIDVPDSGDDTVVLYGHLDKQPEMTGWDDDLGPWQPVLRDDKLYGRGGADDGYALFGSIAALLALHEQGVAHARCVIIIEACEESDSYDLPHYVDHLADRIGEPSPAVRRIRPSARPRTRDCARSPTGGRRDRRNNRNNLPRTPSVAA